MIQTLISNMISYMHIQQMHIQQIQSQSVKVTLIYKLPAQEQPEVSHAASYQKSDRRASVPHHA